MEIRSGMRVDEDDRTDQGVGPKIALACGVLGVIGAVWAYWMVVPGIVFGLAAIALGVRARRSGRPEVGAAALTLGIVALFLVPSVLFVADGAEDWGRDCALNPTNPDC